eukprot:TRINITY_DN29971_c0_g1_i4.p1 TRINITY_DN29971_c0_g1~~TRINITY_DN29971_c0_g1_i4.p1  ORF type:complete len:226 (-),score=46.99 TRINITY_DN29971_c0_g1_i4:3-611(-)
MRCRIVDYCLIWRGFFFFFSSRRRHTRCREVSWARRCVQETVSTQSTWDSYGDVTTPQLHYMVYDTFNKKSRSSLENYYKAFSEAFMSFLGPDVPKSKLYVDCAGGIGGIQFSKLNEYTHLDVSILNSGSEKENFLNNLCGAEFVQKKKKKKKKKKKQMRPQKKKTKRQKTPKKQSNKLMQPQKKHKSTSNNIRRTKNIRQQ